MRLLVYTENDGRYIVLSYSAHKYTMCNTTDSADSAGSADSADSADSARSQMGQAA